MTEIITMATTHTEHRWLCPRCGRHKELGEPVRKSLLQGIEICEPCGFQEGQAFHLRGKQPTFEDWVAPPTDLIEETE